MKPVRLLVCLLMPLLGGCSALMVGELGYAAHLNGPLHGADGAFHMGFGFTAGATDREPAYGLGFSGRVRSYGTPYTAIEPGLHAYILKDSGPLSFYLRGTAYTGLGFLPGRTGPVFSPTLQPGVLFCPDSRVGWCGTLSLPVSYDVLGPEERPGLALGVSFGIGWGNVISRRPFNR